MRLKLFIVLLIGLNVKFCIAQDNSLQVAHGFMNEMRNFLKEEGFTPTLEDDFLSFKKEGIGYHLQVTGTGPFIYQFYVDAVEMPKSVSLDKLLIDINEASASGALIHTVYEEKNEPLTVLIRVAGATRNVEDFKYVFYSYLTGLQYGYNQALSYAQNPGTNYPNPSVSFSRSDDLKVKNVFVNDDMTVIDF